MTKFRHIKNSDLNKNKWDLCISNSCNNRVYALSWYLDIVTENWDGLVYGDYQSVFPVIFKKRGFLKKCYHPFFCQQLGLFFPKHEKDKNTLFLLQECLHCLDEKIKSYEFCSTSELLNVLSIYKSSKPLDTSHCPLNFNLVRKNLELDLKINYTEIASSYSKNTIRNLKRANECNLVIEDCSKTQAILSLFKENIGEEANLKSKDYIILSNLIDYCLDKGVGNLIGVVNANKKLIASAFIISHFKRDILICNASDKDYKEIHGMTYLIDYYIRKNAGSDKVLDFEGSNLPGVYRFYQGFSAIESNYLLIKSKNPGFLGYTSF